MAKRTVYHPPSRKATDELAQKVCERLGKERDASYNTPEVILGLAKFLELAAGIWAKHLTKLSEEKSQNLDNDTK
jgi:hypothetical protein